MAMTDTVNTAKLVTETCFQQQLADTEQRMGDMFTPNQILGRLSSIGCVAIEITQKCNLDCTLCYLSEHSQSVMDVPIEEIYRRLDQVIAHYGKGTHVQITGGDPTLRKHTELIDIVRYASNIGLHPALFTNGIAASRALLKRLAKVGLRDVAFHVDTTQRRSGGCSEQALNTIRDEYIERTQGLGLMVIFNTTVHKDNFSDIPDLVHFFRQRADKIGLVSFQLQADTGRGEWRSRDTVINQHTVRQQIETGSSANLPWEAIQVGHTECHNYLPTLVVNDTVYPVVLNKHIFADFMRDFQGMSWARQQSRMHLLRNFFRILIKHPVWCLRLPVYAIGLLRMMGRDLLRARGQVKNLQQDRVDACSFMVMTAQGPVSMCEHNARRDDYILRPLDITRADGSSLHYEPLNKSTNKDKRLQSIPIQLGVN